MPERLPDVVVFRSGLLYEADLVAGALQERGIPHYQRMEALGGPQFAMPYGAANGPGTTWAVLVPQQAVREANEVIHALPVSHQVAPGPWAFNPTPRAKVLWRLWAILILSALAIGYASDILRVLRLAFR